MRPPTALATLNSPAVAVLGSFLLMIIKRLFLRSDINILSSCDSGLGCFVGSIILRGVRPPTTLATLGMWCKN